MPRMLIAKNMKMMTNLIVILANARRKPTTGGATPIAQFYKYRNFFDFRYRDFIIEEAEVDSDVDEDEEYEGEVGEIGIVGNEVEESGQTAREIENRRRMVMLWE